MNDINTTNTTNTTNTEVVNVKVKNIHPKYLNLDEWISDKEFNVYIGRARIVFIDGIRYPSNNSIWSNPYKITETQSREQVLNLYRAYIETKLKSDPELIKELNKLRGKKLGCWCKPEKCHGDILVELIEKYSNK